MVFFSCDGCAEMLKKNQVDGHATRCRRCISVSCVDCSVSFFGDDYRSHTSCVTEVERYEKRAPKTNGKIQPQQLWMEVLAASIDTAPAHLRSYIKTMSMLDNVPRKEKAFYNFTSNSLNLKEGNGKGIVAEIWSYLCDKRKEQELAYKQNVEIGEAVEEERQLSEVTTTTGLQEQKGKNDKNNNEVLIKALSKADHDTKQIANKKVVKKTMKQVFKQAKCDTLTIKALRKAVKAQFNKDEHTLVKGLLQNYIDQGKYFTQKGKIISLNKN